MGNSDFDNTVDTLGQRLILIVSRAHELSAMFQNFRTKAELLKIDILKRGLENHTKSLARQAGFKSIVRDGRKRKAGLVAAAAGTVLGGILGRDWSAALAAGMSGFDGALQELGKSTWAVSLDGDLLVVPRNQITSGRTWVTLESLLLALEGLKEKIPVGEQFDNISAMVAEIKLGHISLIQLLIVKQLDTGTES
jgi:hypothetical protein